MNEHPSTDQLLLDKLQDVIESNLDNEQFGVTELATESSLSKSQLNRKLQALTGQSASQFIREYRLKKAMKLLQDNAATASEVSYLVGFGSPSYFSSCFHDFFGYPPSEVKFRKVPVNEKPTKNKWKRVSLISLSAIVIVALSYFSINYLDISTHKEVDLLIQDNTIAVLTFRDDSEGNKYQYFCDGMMAEIIGHLQEVNE